MSSPARKRSLNRRSTMGDKSPADKSKMSGGDSQEKVNDKDGLVPSLDLNVLDATPDKIGGGDGEEGKFGLGT